jgi:hypothetical protein
MDREDWRAYYTAKRIGQQWLQVELLGRLPAQRVLEIGPHLGLVTAMLDNAGLAVTTLDVGPRRFARPEVPHIEADLLTLDPRSIAGFDAILCAETLEHLPWDRVPEVLATLRASGTPYLVVSVPYEGFQLELSLYLNRWTLRQRFQLKKLRGLRRFRPGGAGAHQWELGYRGHGLRAWEAALRAGGWRILRREFSYPCRSAFHVLARDQGR